MAGLFGVDIKAIGAKKVSALLKRARDGIDNIFKPPKHDPRSIPKQVLKMQQDRFAKKGTNVRAQKDPDRKGWKRPLSKNTRRKENKDRNQILTDTDKLRKAVFIARDVMQSMLVGNTGHALIGVRHAQNRQVAAGSKTNKKGGAEKGTVYATKFTDEYGNLHQKGLGGMPKRTFIGVGKEDAKEIEDGMKSKFDRFIGRFI